MEDKNVIPTGNDSVDGDARAEERMDKDEDLKKGNDNESPLAEPFKNEKKPLTPHSLSAPDGNHGHSLHNTRESDQPDPTSPDEPESPVNR